MVLITQGSSLTFSAQGGRGKEKNLAAENPVRPSEGMAEGGCGGNSAMPERNQKVDSPAVLLEEAGHHRKILFSLGEKEIRRAQNEKSKEYFSVVWRAERAVAGLASLLGVLLKKSSNINQKTPQNNEQSEYILAEREGFEPSRPFRACRFSKPVPSTAQPSLHEKSEKL